MTDTTLQDDARPPVSRVELVSLLAMLTATVAFSIDAMLPALPDIGAALSPDDANRAQLVISSFFMGLGLGTLFAGPLTDAYGRKTISVVGAVIFTVAAVIGALSQSIEALLIARFFQGLGASGPRVGALAIIRDLFSGRQMAQVMSYIIFVFSLTPVLAPSLGWMIAWAFGWRAIFLSFAAFSVISMTWLLLRLPETLRPENKRPFRVSKLIEGTREVVSNRQVMFAMMGQTMIFATLFATLMSSQQIFDITFGRGHQFPFLFGGMALLAASSSLINARLVVRLGMQTVVRRTLLVHSCFTLIFLAAQLTGLIEGNVYFVLTFLWLTSTFFLAGFAISNMNALSMEPLGHMAGLGASIVTACATIVSALIAMPIGLAFNGTPLPLTVGTLALVFIAFLLVRQITDTASEA